MSHHGSGPFDPKPMSDLMKRVFGEYPDGRLNTSDEGAVAMIVGANDGRVVLQFPKPVAWLGLTPDEAIGLAELLVKRARECGSKKPLTFNIG